MTSNKTASNKIRIVITLGLFVLLSASTLIAFGFSSMISTWWTIKDDNVILYGLVTLGISLVVGFGLSFAYSAFVSRVTKPYIEALQHVGEGKFDVRIKDSPALEGYHIASNFNEMVTQLEGLEMLRESFVSDFSHEFKTPIVSIEGFARLLKNTQLTQQQRNEYLDVIISESNRLVTLAEHVLLLNRLNTATVVKQSYNLDEQIRQTVLLFDKQLTQRNLDLRLQLDKVDFCCSQQLVSQLLVNLIANAIKFSKEGGSVGISCKTVGGNVQIAVSDDGCGMTPEVQRNIFNKFYQGDSSRTTEGNGLGLSICQKIVQLLQGEIAVESQLGVGSCFTVTLPKQ